MKCGINLQTTEYQNIYSSRKEIKNDDINKTQHYYSEDIWGRANNILKEFIDEGMTLYYEIVGFLGDGSYIQKDYDYGCKGGEFLICIYRITTTNTSGKVYEFSAKQVQQWCKNKGLNSVKELYYGYAKDLYPDIINWSGFSALPEEIKKWQEKLLDRLIKDDINFFMEQDCPFCNNKVPFEGIVIRKENLDIEPYKLKCFRFLEKETKELDSGAENIEENQEVE